MSEASGIFHYIPFMQSVYKSFIIGEFSFTMLLHTSVYGLVLLLIKVLVDVRLTVKAVHTYCCVNSCAQDIDLMPHLQGKLSN